jgi:serine/threonine-protein kinase
LQPLAVDSDSALCPVCLSGDDTYRPPGRGGNAPGERPLPDTLRGSTPGEKPRPKWPDAPPGYELVRPLGGGGMGDVFLARDLMADRLVAIKFLRHPGHPTAVERFLTEVRALAAIDHPGIVRVFGHDFHRAVPYFTMEFVAGGSLGERVRAGGPLDPAEAARVAVRAARAVSEAHARGILHRDLKPSNILLAEDGTPKVSDFGLAKRTDRDDGITTFTGPLGTPSYMPPEQVSGRHGEVGAAADVYGLGATLYTLLTRRAPFTGDSHAEIVSQVEVAPPARVRALRPEVPLGLEAIALKCLAKKPADRYPTAAALADDLERFLAGGTPNAPHLTGWRRASRWAIDRRRVLAGGAAALVLGGGLVYAGLLLAPESRREVSAEAIRRELAARRPVTLVGATGLPVYHRCPLEAVALGTTLSADRTCSYHAFHYGLVELCPAPGVAKYRVEAELRHLQTVSDSLRSEFVGFYFGHATLEPAPDVTTHRLLAVTLLDGAPPATFGLPPGQAPLQFQLFRFTQSPDDPLVPATGALAPAVPFTPRDRLPGPWRKIVVEVTPDEVHVLWKENAADGAAPRTVIRWTAAEVRRRFETPRASGTSGAEPAGWIPGWNPDRPFGVISRQAAVAIRNVVVTPLD